MRPLAAEQTVPAVLFLQQLQSPKSFLKGESE